MSYTALYRKWRPATFDEVKGQDHIVTTLKNQINGGRIGHAYLFCGTRGTGKTSVAKIFAKAVNCEHPVDGNPCGKCASCQAIASGASMNVVEIDAASNNGVDNIRQIRDEVEYSPADAKYRVYIIDEVHMLSTGAFNALLKTLEEPPSYVIFILATTEVHRIPITVLSRCQRYDFRRIDGDTITARLAQMAKAEGIDAEDKALRYVAKKGDGSLRDSISLFDQCVAFYYGQKLTYERVLDVLGAVDNEVYSRFFRTLSGGNVGQCLRELEELVLSGRDLTQFVSDFIWYLRGMLLVQTGEDSGDFLDMSQEDLDRLSEDSRLVSQDTVMRYIRVLSETMNQMRYSASKRVLLEISLIRLAKPAMETNLDSVLQRLEEVERQLASGVLVQAPAGGGQGTGAAAAGMPGGAELMEGNARKAQEETVVLPPAQLEQLRLLSKEWKQIIAAVGGTAKATLTDVILEPRGEGKLDLIFHNENHYNIVSRGNHLKELKEYIASAYQVDVNLTAVLVAEEEYTHKNYVTEEELKQKFNVDIIME